jgi:hypothetical protein
LKKNSFHIIQDQSIEIEFEDLDAAVGIQNRIAEIFNNRILPKMDLLFTEIAGDDHLISLENLEIDCGVLPNKNWEKELIEKTLRGLKEELITKHKKRLITQEEISKIAGESLLFFLEHGYLPWNTGYQSLAELEKEIAWTIEFTSQLKEKILVNEKTINRLLYNFSADFHSTVVREITNNNREELRLFYSICEQLTNKDSHIIQYVILKVFSSGINKKPSLPALLSELYNYADEVTKKEVIKTAKEILDVNVRKLNDDLSEKEQPKKQKQKTDEGIFINNAGLVLLHPFLPQLFETTGLTIKNEWVGETSRYHAIALLQFLLSGKNDFEEFNLPLNKILCGMNTDDVYKPAGEINEFEQLQCESLVTDVIKYWAVLKNTGAESFRETFLKRNGKLTPVDKGWLLQVEQNAVDILLSSLPWGIGTIKLKWMNEIIYTEWN